MDDARAKREARRRKILENSEKRLEKITRIKYEDSAKAGKNLRFFRNSIRSTCSESFVSLLIVFSC